MSFRLLAVGILALVIGTALCFAGYRAFRALIAIWGFFAGFLLTVQAVGVYSEGHFLVSIGGLAIAFVVGLILAALAYYLYVAAVVILSASVGFWVGTGIMMALGYGNHSTPALIAGLICAVAMAVLTLALDLTKFLIVISTSLGGASSIIAGILLLLGKIPLEALSFGMVGAIISSSQLWGLVWLVLAIVGIIVQLSSTQSYAHGHARAQFYKSERKIA
ncbi:MAG TPA: DUF4203 domain-containing protein [Ktedonobacteraceae bacterium]